MSSEDHLGWAKLRAINLLTLEEPEPVENVLLGFFSDVNKHPELRVEHAARNEEGFAKLMDGEIVVRDDALNFITAYA